MGAPGVATCSCQGVSQVVEPGGQPPTRFLVAVRVYQFACSRRPCVSLPSGCIHAWVAPAPSRHIQDETRLFQSRHSLGLGCRGVHTHMCVL
jgi:hypothetical protein